MARFTFVLLAAVLLCDAVLCAAVGSKEAAYVGGSTPLTRKGDDAIEGNLVTDDEKELRFVGGKKGNEQSFVVPYSTIYALEFGHTAGRRSAANVTSAITPTPLLIAKFFKKKRRLLTVYYKDEYDKEQFVILELGKDIIRTTLATVEMRSGKNIEYQDEEAEKVGAGR